MGGNAFARPGPNGEPPLNTPRMDPDTYYCRKEDFKDVLLQFFEKVECPIEAPGKESYGDIDLLVASPKRAGVSVRDIADELRAERFIDVPNNHTVHFAVEDKHWYEMNPYQGPCYFQVDVRICPSTADLRWHYFTHSHGDFWNILGTTILRPAGLTINDTGLYARIQEIEASNGFNKNKECMLLLTDSPERTLEFLGLQPAEYFGRQFKSIEELFDFASKARFFAYIREPGFGGGRGDHVGLLRRREERGMLKKREMYRRWFDDYLPRLLSDPPHTQLHGPESSTPDGRRGEIFREAIEHFVVRAEYNSRISNWRDIMYEANVWEAITAAIPLPPGDAKRATIRGLKRMVDISQGFPVWSREVDLPRWDSALRASTYWEDKAALMSWVRAHWMKVGDCEKAWTSWKKAERQRRG